MMKRLSAEQQGHLLFLALAASVITASMILTPSDSAVSLFGIPIPPLCMWKRITGWDCPGCGLTRSFTYMGHGDVLGAFARHKLGPLLYLGVAAQIPWRIFRLIWPAGSRPLGDRPSRGYTRA